MADSPKEGEAAQALFCAIVDLKGAAFPSNIPNYTVFKQKYKREISTVRRKVVTPGVSENGIEKLLLRIMIGFYHLLILLIKFLVKQKG